MQTTREILEAINHIQKKDKQLYFFGTQKQIESLKILGLDQYFVGGLNTQELQNLEQEDGGLDTSKFFDRFSIQPGDTAFVVSKKNSNTNSLEHGSWQQELQGRIEDVFDSEEDIFEETTEKKSKFEHNFDEDDMNEELEIVDEEEEQYLEEAEDMEEDNNFDEEIDMEEDEEENVTNKNQILKWLERVETDKISRLPKIPKIIFVGKPNVGKSSLFNAMAGENIQIISDIAGTTLSVNDTMIEIDIGF